MIDEAERETADTMRERAEENRLKLWILLGSNRHLLTGVLTAFVFVAFVIAVVALPPSFAQQIESDDVIETLFATMIPVVVTGTTLVVTIGQLVLTQENGPLGDQRSRMNSSMEVRAFIQELIGSPPSTNPSEFLTEILDATITRSEAFRTSFGTPDGRSLRREVKSLTDDVVGNAETVREQLEGAQFGSFDVVFAALNFNYGRKIARLERIEYEYDESLTESELDALDDLKAALSLFAPAREHVKTLYFQWSLIDLSRQILYAAIPAVVVAGIMVAVVNAGTFPGSTFGIDHVILVVGGAFALTLVPFMLFVSYVLRILTVAKRTLAIEPLVLRDSER